MKKKIVKILIFYTKLLDNVLLRTLYLGVLEHTPQIFCQLCNLVCFGPHFRDISLNSFGFTILHIVTIVTMEKTIAQSHDTTIK